MKIKKKKKDDYKLIREISRVWCGAHCASSCGSSSTFKGTKVTKT